MTDVKVDPGYIDDLADYIESHLDSQMVICAQQAELYGCRKKGFTGLLEPLQAVMDTLAEQVHGAGQFMLGRIEGTAGALHATARDYRRTERKNRDRMDGE